MANDFFDKYKAKGSDDLETIAQQVPPAAPATPQGSPTTFAETAEERPAAAQADASPATMRFEQDATNGFTAPVRTAPAATHAAQGKAAGEKTLFGIPLLYIGIGVAAILAIILAVLLLGRGKALPAMDGWSTSDAERWTNENKINMRVEKVFSDEVSAGTIISQSPATGERVKKDDFLTVTVSEGPDLSVLVPVPDVMNMTMPEVEAWADANFMTTVRVTTQTSDTVPSGKVISFTINDNTVLTSEIRRDTPFYVVFSKGKPAGEAVEVPNFLTMSVAEAEAFALEKEIVLVKQEEFSETVSVGNVIRQDIKAGEKVYTGDTITIVVSKGKEVLVPNFYALTRAMAEATASQLGIQTLVEEEYSSKEKDQLISQSISAGTLYQDDDIIVLKYSKGNTVFLDSYVGQDESALRQWCEGYNEQGASITIVVNQIENTAAMGTILRQNFDKENIAINATIEILVSRGKMVIMPSLAQKPGDAYNSIITKDYVSDTCEALGLIPLFIEQNNSSYKAGEVWEQAIVAGSEVQVGTVVTFKIVPVSSAANVSVPNFFGQNYQAVKQNPNSSKLSISYQNESGAPLDESVLSVDYAVVAQSVNAGSQVKEGYPIVLTMQASISVPDFREKSYGTVSANTVWNENFNLVYENENKEILTDAEMKGKGCTVKDQSVDPNTMVKAGYVITLTMETPAETPASSAATDASSDSSTATPTA